MTPSPDGPPTRGGIRGNPWAVLIALCLGFFMILLDTTIVNVAIPDIIDKVGTSLDEALWVVNAYVLVYAVLLISAGRLGDIVGPRTMFMAGLVVFVVASAACVLSQSPGQLIAARAVQGVGGAMLTPQTLTILTTIFPRERRGAAFGIWGAVAGVATVTGPTLGGYLVTEWDWRWIFFVNLPVGVIALVLAVVLVPDLRPGRKHRLDLLGVALASAGLTALTYGLLEGERYDWGTIRGFVSIPAVLVLGVVLLAAFAVWQRVQRSEPLLPFEVFRDRNFTLTSIVAAALTFGMLGIFLPLTIYLQTVLDLTALEAGLTIAPMPLVAMVLAPLAGRLADRIGGKYLLVAGLLLFAGGIGAVVATTGPDSGRWDFLAGLLVAGLGMGFIFAPLQTVSMRDIPPRLAGSASGVQNTIRQLGGVIGGAVVGAVLQNRLASALHDQAQAHAAQLPAPFRDRFVDGFDRAASGGLQLGTGQSGADIDLPKDLDPQTAEQVGRLAHDVFVQAYVDAMHPTLAVPIAVLAAAGLACLGISRHRRSPTSPPPPTDDREPAGHTAD
ncbi:MAG: DHA2 family efflux MFS transporter permease subunit [Streptosporangiales bacterium]|nr:DHA2 family efflux MFS transporter permease subunit [Streptosporangiales bacterium]